MATWDDVRRITLALPETTEGTSYGNLAWKVGGKAFAWDRPLRASDVAALGPDAPHGAILGVRTDGLEMKEALLKSDRAIFFTIPHFDGFAAVLVRLSKIDTIRLRDVLTDAWLVRATPKLAKAFLDERRA
ncbi:MAG TPA: MmcQ/YjbR family DNA-binding protein [Candidatus Tumulicola sp.]